MIAVLLIFLAIVCYVDIKTKIIQDGLSLLGILVFLNWQLFFGDIRMAIIGLTVGVLTTFFFNEISGTMVGGGDAKIMGLIGCVIGWQVVFVLILSKILCWVYRKVTNNYKTIAYAPFITIGMILWTGISYFGM